MVLGGSPTSGNPSSGRRLPVAALSLFPPHPIPMNTSPIDKASADNIEREIDPAIGKADNCIFPTPWHYEFELHSDEVADSTVVITDHSGYEFASFSGDC